jgi:hypothetical protein
MEINTFMCGFATAAVIAIILVGGYWLHLRIVAKDILDDDRKKLREWAYKEAQIRADEQVRDILSSLQVNMPVVLVNESDMNWGDDK